MYNVAQHTERLRRTKLYNMDAADVAAVISRSLDAAERGNDSGLLVDGNEEVSLVIGAAGFAFGLDLPVGGRSVGERCGEFVGGEAELDGNFGADEIGEAVVIEGNDVFVEFVADNLGAAVVAGASGHIAFLDTPKGEGKGIDGGEMARGAKASAQGAAEKIGELVVGEETVAVANQVTKHLRPTHPSDQADQCEYAGDDQEGPSAALRVADPEERHEKGVPNEGAREAAEHGVESGEADAFRAPVEIEEPRLARSFRGFASVNSLADYAANAVDKEEEAGGEKHGAKDGDEPERCVLSGLDDVEGGETDEDAGDHEGQAEECGRAAIDGGSALGGVVWESGRQAGTAAQHALLDGAGSFGGGSDGEGHGCALGQSAGGKGY